MAGIDRLHSEVAAQAPRLLRRRRVPPLGRVVRTGTELGAALAGWRLLELPRSRRRDGPSISRSGVSRRLRRGFEPRAHLHQSRPGARRHPVEQRARRGQGPAARGVRPTSSWRSGWCSSQARSSPSVRLVTACSLTGTFYVGVGEPLRRHG